MSYWLWFAAVVLMSLLTVIVAYQDAVIAVVLWAIATAILLMLRPD